MKNNTESLRAILRTSKTEGLEEKLRETVKRKSSDFEDCLGTEGYSEYIDRVTEYLLDESIPVEKKKEVFEAVKDRQLIGGLA